MSAFKRLTSVAMTLESGRKLSVDVHEQADIFQRAWDGVLPFSYVLIVDGRVYRDVLEATYGYHDGTTADAVPDGEAIAKMVEELANPEGMAIRAETRARIRRKAGLPT